MEVLQDDIQALQAAFAEADVERVRAILIRQLQRSWSEETQRALEEALEALQGQDITEESIAQLQGQLRASLGPAFAQLQGETLSAAFETAHLIGKTQAEVDVALGFGIEDRQAIEAVQQNTTYWIGRHYDRFVNERIKNTGQELLEDGAGAWRTGQAFAEEFSDDFQKSQEYWDLLGTVTTTRSRSFGQVQALVDAGATAAEIDAVIDHRTSTICRKVNGMVVSMDRMTEHRDAILNAQEPEQVKEIAPWPSDEQAEEWEEEDFKENGVIIPPLHGHCRSGLVIATR